MSKEDDERFLREEAERNRQKAAQERAEDKARAENEEKKNRPRDK